MISIFEKRIKKFLVNSRWMNRKVINEYLTLIRKNTTDIKSDPDFLNENKRENTGIKYNDDIIFNTKHFSEEFKKFHNLSSLFSDMKKNRPIDEKLLDGISSSIEKKPIDSVLFNISMTKYNIVNGYYVKAMTNIKNSLRILEENNYSEYDSLAVSLRLDKALIESYKADNFRDMKSLVMKEIYMGYIINDPALVITGYLYLYRHLALFNNFPHMCALMHLTYEYSNQNKIKNKFVSDSLYFQYIALQFKVKYSKKFISEHSDPAKMNSIYDVFCNSDNYMNQPQKYFKLIETLNKTIHFFKTNNYDDPILSNLYLKKWVAENSIGREATCDYNLELARNLVFKKNNIAESSLTMEFLKNSVMECFYYLNYPLGNEFTKKNIKINNKLTSYNLLFKAFNLIGIASARSQPSEVLDKYEDFVKTYNRFFPNNEYEDFKIFVKETIISFGYQTLFETNKNKKADIS
jgi:hypothetical protein